MIMLEANWRVRPAFWVLFVSAIAIPGAVAVSKANDSRAEDYDQVAWKYEGFERKWPPGLFLELGITDDRNPNGLHTFRSMGGTMSGPFTHGRAGGSWNAFDSDGRLFGQVAIDDGLPTGPCDFWDPAGGWRIHGTYEHWERVGLWTFDNVLGEGRKYVLYRPAWSVN